MTTAIFFKPFGEAYANVNIPKHIRACGSHSICFDDNRIGHSETIVHVIVVEPAPIFPYRLSVPNIADHFEDEIFRPNQQ